MKNTFFRGAGDFDMIDDYDMLPAQDPIDLSRYTDEGEDYRNFSEYRDNDEQFDRGYGRNYRYDEFDDDEDDDDIDLSALTNGKKQYVDVSAEFFVPGYGKKRIHKQPKKDSYEIPDYLKSSPPREAPERSQPEERYEEPYGSERGNAVRKPEKREAEKEFQAPPPDIKPEPRKKSVPEAADEQEAEIKKEPAQPEETVKEEQPEELSDLENEESEEKIEPVAAAPDFVPLPVPEKVKEIIDLLKAHTYTSYLVGDCVSLMMLGERVMDFDIACDAEIGRIIAIFDEKFKVREDLIERGELIIINGAMGISVAPYRSKIDENGRPVYCKTIEEDLRRRTFTSETVAYNVDTGVYDRFGGLSCITEEKTTLKAIDEELFERQELEYSRLPKKKRKELPPKVIIDALKENPESILLAMLKFSRGEAEISPYTLKNINDNPDLLEMILPAEIYSDFRKILLGRRITDTMIKFKEIFFYLFPVLKSQEDFDQRSDYQEYTLYEHTAKSVGYAYPDYSVRLALMLHAAGKPDCAADRGEFNTYDGHAERGIMLAREVLEKLETDEQTTSRVLFLIRHHDDRITPDNVLDYSNRYGAEITRLLLLMQSANIRAKSSDRLNDRVSDSLRQLADNLNTNIAVNNAARQRVRQTGSIDLLRRFGR